MAVVCCGCVVLCKLQVLCVRPAVRYDLNECFKMNENSMNENAEEPSKEMPNSSKLLSYVIFSKCHSLIDV